MLKFLRACAAVAALGSAACAFAQSYPSRPIQLILTAGPGSATDVVARIVGDELGRQLGQPVVVDNRPGAGGNIAAELVAKAQPDGHTLLIATTSTHGVNPSLYRSMRFDPVKDFTPVMLLAKSPNVLVVSSKSTYKSVADIVAAAKKKPGEITFSSGGNGTSQHIAGELFSMSNGLKMLHIPYKSAPQAMNAVLAGEVDLSFVSATVALPQAKAGSVRAFGVTSNKRMEYWPELPTLESQGLKNFDVSAWFGVVAPAGTPQPVLDKLYAALAKTMQLPQVKGKLQVQGMVVVADTPDQFKAFIRSEISRWAPVVRASGATLD
jgi:tripartite-type tricarboxylate transporter receptor subunit TctC